LTTKQGLKNSCAAAARHAMPCNGAYAFGCMEEEDGEKNLDLDLV